MTTVEILEAARDLIANPARWTQGDFARDEGGVGVNADNGDAVCWCAVGGVRKVAESIGELYEPNILLDRASGELYPESESNVVWVNDRLGHDAVLRVYDRAIELAS